MVDVKTAGGGEFRGVLFALLDDRIELVGAEVSIPGAVVNLRWSSEIGPRGAVVPLSLARDGSFRMEGFMDASVIPVPLLSVTYRID